ncbi:MAG: UvrD-helicase domain-containing protein [Nitrospinota bacterium]
MSLPGHLPRSGHSLSLNEDQEEAALCLSQNVCVSAGAGTGKTRVLVRRALELLLSGEGMSGIAAITFTEKAAKEMRERLRSCLPRSGLRDGLNRARARLEASYIGTIHGFCRQVLSDFSLEAGLDPDFRVMDEREARRTLDEVLQEGLRELKDELAPLLLELGPSGTRKLLRRMLEERQKHLELEVPEEARELLSLWGSLLDSHKRERLRALLESPRWRAAMGALRGESDSRSKRAEEIRRELLRVEERLRKELTSGGWQDHLPPLKDAIKSKVNLGPAFSELKLLYKEVEEALELSLGELDERAARLLPPLLRAFRALERRLWSRKLRDGALDFTDLLIKARELLLEKNYVRAALLRRYRAILLDELQDTDMVQREVVYLAAGAPPGGPPPPGRLFAVGDPWQSIYRFRGADVSVFERVKEDVSAGQGLHRSLGRNFRSEGGILKFVNALCGGERNGLRADPGWRAYDPPYIELRREPGGPPGDPTCVELLLIEGGRNSSEGRQLEARRLASRIKRITDGEPPGPFLPGEIALLFRRMTDASLYGKALEESGLPCYLVGGRGFFSAPEVLDLMNLLRVLESPWDALSLAGVLRSPLVGLTDDALLWMALSGGLLKAFAEPSGIMGIEAEERERLLRARELLISLRSRKDHLPPHLLLEEALAETGFRACLGALPRGEQALANVEKFLSLARAVSRRGGALADLIADLSSADEKESEAQLGEERDQVKLMTVHKAKGLEFPLVIIPDLAGTGRGEEALYLYDRDLGLGIPLGPEGSGKEIPAFWKLLRLKERFKAEAEERRLLYVAATRAEKYLILSASLPQGERKARRGYWLRWLMDSIGLEEGEGKGLFRLSREKPPFAPEEAEARGDRMPLEISPSISPPDENGKGVLLRQVSPLPVKTRPRKLSATALQEYARCPARFRFRHLLHLFPPEPLLGESQEEASGTGGATLGEVVHRALEAWDFHSEGSLEASLKLALASQRGLSEKDVAALYKEAKGLILRASGGTLAPSGLLGELSRATSLRREVPFILRLNEESPLIEGTIDCVYERDSAAWVCDFKTERVGEEGVEARASLYRVQLGIYALAVARAEGNFGGARVFFLREEKAAPLFQGMDSLTAFERELGELLSGIEKGLFPERLDGCQHCGFRPLCLG